MKKIEKILNSIDDRILEIQNNKLMLNVIQTSSNNKYILTMENIYNQELDFLAKLVLEMTK